MTKEELHRAADELAMKWWGVKYDGLIILSNMRWRKMDGQFWAPSIRKIPNGIELSPVIRMCKKRNAERTEEEVRGVLLHELVHWRLFCLGIPHGDVDREFIEEAVRVGAPISQERKAQRAYKQYMRGELS